MTLQTYNPYFWDIFSAERDSVCSNICINHPNVNIQPYVKEMVGTTEAFLGKGSVKAVVIFGSATYDKMTEHSDIDLLIVVCDHISNKQIRKIEPYLNTIEIKHNFASLQKRIDTRITQILDQMTGMFCSHFICRKEAWETQKFSQIFNVNRAISQILAPNRIVLDSMKDGARLLQGKLDLSPIIRDYPKSQLVKSLNMTLLLSIGSLFILPLHKRNMRYILEAYKWALRSCAFFLFKEAWPLERIITLFKHFNITNGYLDRFISLREKPALDWKFALKLPWQIIKLHITTIRMRKMH